MTATVILIRLSMLVIAAILLGTIAFHSFAADGISLLRKYPPDFGWSGLARTLFCILAAGLVALALKPHPAHEGALPAATDQTTGFGVAYGAMLFYLALFTMIVVTVPEILNETVREGQLTSILTEIAFVIAIACLLSAAWRARRAKSAAVWRLPSSLVVLAIAAAAALALLEEASYGQHWIGWSTPEAFSANLQNETNLHNFHTHKFELVYYGLAVLAFVVLPAFWPRGPGGIVASLGTYIPPRAFALIGVPVTSFMFEMWNGVIFQTLFWLGIFVLADLRSAARRQARPDFSAMVSMSAGFLIVAQGAFVTFGHGMVDGFELSEVREFYIALLTLAYAAWLNRRFAEPYRSVRRKPLVFQSSF